MFLDVAEHLCKDGAIAVIPTDTVYGVVGRAADELAVARVYATKHRISKPGTLVAASVDQLVELGIKRRYLTAVEQYWPGPVSVVVPVSNPSLEYLHQGKSSLSVRIPNDDALLELLTKTGPLITTSANRPDEPVSTTIQQAKDYFGDRIELYIDGGDLSGREASTIIRVVDDAVEVLRQGALKL